MLKTPRFKTCVLAVTMAALPWFANAAGLGRLNVLSGLGQPFRGEIDLVSVLPGEADSLVVSLASPEAFSNAQITYPSGALGLRFNIEKRGNGQHYVAVKSSQAISEPYLDFLLELNWASGRIQREYTALIDPAGYSPTASTKFAASALPGVRSSGVIKPSKPNQVQSGSLNERARSTESSAEARDAESYKTKGGDTLSGVARAVQTSGVSLDQVLVGLYRNNPDAFDGNMNRLKRGKILRLPSASEMQALSAQQASKEVKVQAENWNEYRSKLGDLAAKSSARDLAAQSAGGKIVTQVEDQGAGAVDKNKDVLKLSKAVDLAKKSGDLAKVQALEEEVAARQKALNEANQRVAELQKNVSDMERLVAMKAKASDVAASTEAAAVAPVASAASQVEVAAPSTVASEVVASRVASAPAVKVKKRVEVVADVPEETGFVASLFENPLAVGGGALAVLLGVGGLWMVRRRQRPNVFEDSIITGGDLKANTVLGSTGGGVISTQSTENSFLTDFSRQGLGTIDTDEVDPIAEAEVYMAYGRDAQAEEILKDALNKDPSRHEIRMKLLDIYAARKDFISYEEHASALFAMLGGKGEHWERVAQTGHEIDPENPLYQQSEVIDTRAVAAVVMGGAAVVATAEAASQDLDFELDLEPPSVDRAEVDFSENKAPIVDLPVEEARLESEFAEGLAGTGLDLDQDLSFDLAESAALEPVESDFGMERIEAPTVAPGVEEDESLLAGEMMALDFPIDLPVDASSMAAALSDLDELAEFDFGGSLNTDTDTDTDTDADAEFDLSSFDALASSLDLDADSSSLASTFDLALPEEALPELVLSEPISENISAVPAAETANEMNLDFNFDLASPLGSELDAISADEQLNMDLAENIALDDISLNLDEAATSSEMDFSADDPVQTKIDLARAYIDMGDVEGAREILQEALQEGSAQQQGLAQSLLADL
ncbi:FimV/HubP family polar landmark protein [uncultured Deefgea sp.]|uniref:FimV/HubP family polar landmark protein n=1 Tax=uncultured Deefgea sp. TaxID=1304914 RepID=UPI00261ECF18|nr:FimV/HubP family polar landmark protein [uncultured Deefgea sp.]